MINQRIEKLAEWGEIIKKGNWSSLYNAVSKSNPWFTKESIDLALDGLNHYLDYKKLEMWSASYAIPKMPSKTVGIIMAGNLPLVGIHDLICSYISGHHTLIKTSSQDNLLIKGLWDRMMKLDPSGSRRITFVSNFRADQIDAIIATGSDNTSRYFKYHYQGIPGIIRGNRSSIAILKGNEPDQEIADLGLDMYSYYGRGCRNVSKLLVPEGYDFDVFFDRTTKYSYLTNNPRYFSNYKYQKAIKTIQNIDFHDNGFCLIMEHADLISPLSVIHYEFYQSLEQVHNTISGQRSKIQCIASSKGWYPDSLPFGILQKPNLKDYADNIDTMEFLLKM